jgi:thiamine-phosphate pyrophosphorylase
VIPKLHIVTDDEVLARPDFEKHAQEVLEVLQPRGLDNGSGDSVNRRLAFHLRGPRTTGRRLTRLARMLNESTSASAVTLIVNDRVDIALAVGAGGVHLGARSLPPVETRRLLGADRLLGVSVHSVSAAVEVAGTPVDYLFVGTLFETPSHAGATVKGPEFMGTVASRVELPLIGIGGVTPERTHEVLGSGGHGVAAIRGIWDSPSPPDAVQAYLDVLESGDPGDMRDLQ